MSKSIADIHRFLGGLATLRSKSARAAGKIAESARDRRQVVEARLDELRPQVHTDEAAAAEYSQLVEERGRLDLVLAQAPTY